MNQVGKASRRPGTGNTVCAAPSELVALSPPNVGRHLSLRSSCTLVVVDNEQNDFIYPVSLACILYCRKLACPHWYVCCPFPFPFLCLSSPNPSNTHSLSRSAGHGISTLASTVLHFFHWLVDSISLIYWPSLLRPRFMPSMFFDLDFSLVPLERRGY
jgi:hypothetical protein